MKKRALSVNDILCYEPKSIGFDGKWKEAMGDPELKGCWTIWGASGQGKTRFLLQLTKYLMSKGVKVAYNSLEEGLSATFKRAIIDSGIVAENIGMFSLWDKLQLDDVKKNLVKKRCPRVIIIDSVQFLDGVTKSDLSEMIDNNPRKLFVFVSHAAGRQPLGALANSLRYKSDIKMYVDDFYNHITSRYSGRAVFDIWPEYHLMTEEEKQHTVTMTEK